MNIRFVPALLVYMTLHLLVPLASQDLPDVPEDLRILQQAYPNAFEIVPGPAIQFDDGRIIPYDDGRSKSFDELLEDSDLQDMMHLPYPAQPVTDPPALNDDPGRFRSESFFMGLYGSREEDVRASLAMVRWMPSYGGPSFAVQTRFNIHRRVEAIVQELELLVTDDPSLIDFLLPPGGSFNFRYIAGTQRLSMHSFGIAVDIAVAPAHYWLWHEDRGAEYKNAIPLEIVQVFQKHGFIWGGNWYHYDTMHFEYRPELLIKAGLEMLPDSYYGPLPD